MNKELEQLTKSFDAKATIKDADVKLGIVTGYLSCFGNRDSDGDVIVKGAFAKTIRDTGPGSSQPRIKHLLDHNTRQAIGVFQVLKEDDYGLYYESKIGSHQLGVDFLKMAESGLITEHSIGYRILKGEWEENPSNDERSYRLLELQLYEGSSLQFWGANPLTPLTGVKADQEKQRARMQQLMLRMEKEMQSGTLSDEAYQKRILPNYQAFKLALESEYTTEPPKSTQPGNDTKLVEALEGLKGSLTNLFNS